MRCATSIPAEKRTQSRVHLHLCASLRASWRPWPDDDASRATVGRHRPSVPRRRPVKARAAKLGGLTLQITQKAGPDGRLFGSVTNYDIVEALNKQGHEVERAQIRMPQGPLKQVGDSPIEIALHTDVTATVTVSVLGEQ